MSVHRRSLGLLLCALLGGALTLGLAALSAAESARLAALLLAGHTEAAAVVETRVLSSRRAGRSHELRYRLASGAGHTDATGRDDLWVPLPEDQWQEARRTGTVEVRVSDAWPGVQAPAAGLMAQAGDLAAAWVLAGLIGAITLLIGWTAARGPTPREAR